MNNRIKELIKQSYDEMNAPNNDPVARELLMKDLLPEYQRFAELIVRECSEFCGHDHEGVMAMFKHFGVKNHEQPLL
jgi:hypothetical protein